jgi:hypothetical protein
LHSRGQACSRSRARRRGGAAALALAGALLAPAAAAEPSVTGQTGLVHMPDARIAPEGVVRFGLAQSEPYFAVWGSLSVFPRFEFSGRYTTIERVPGFADPDLGDYRDKAFDAKLIVREESRRLPAIALGAQDFVGTRLFSAQYVALGKRVGDFDFTLGYGDERIDGAFGGVRYRPARFPGWSLLYEYDANDYGGDFRADLSGAAGRAGGSTWGIGYRASWWGAQLAWQHGEPAANLYLAIPLMARELVPKIDEPAPYRGPSQRATLADWRSDWRHALALTTALERQGFADVHVRVQGQWLELSLTHGRISLIGRAVGRAARTALHLGPSDMKGLRIGYTVNHQPLLTYAFRDLDVLEAFLDGRAERSALERTSVIEFASERWARELRAQSVPVPYGGPRPKVDLPPVAQGRFLAPRPMRAWRSYFALAPFNARIFFNDPGEPVRYDTFALLGYSRALAPGLFLNGSARFTLFENVSDIEARSDSLLPHVRSDIGEYRRLGDRLRLNTLLLNRYALLERRWYARLSAGYYEEMYAGAGGQVLYLPRQGDWALDLAVDALRQRAPGEAFGFRDYSVVTALVSGHYRFPAPGVTLTARAGRFLAGDEGVRLEIKRRFRSGVEVGGWYTWTNEEDITGPGAPGDPYRDKGIFVSIPLKALLTRDTQERASMALGDYARDVGQMVASPGDLYRLVERRLMLDSAAHDPLTGFTR